MTTFKHRLDELVKLRDAYQDTSIDLETRAWNLTRYRMVLEEKAITLAEELHAEMERLNKPMHLAKVGFTCERTGKRHSFDSMTDFIVAFLNATNTIDEAELRGRVQGKAWAIAVCLRYEMRPDELLLESGIALDDLSQIDEYDAEPIRTFLSTYEQVKGGE